jgi:hypothetical protein
MPEPVAVKIILTVKDREITYVEPHPDNPDIEVFRLAPPDQKELKRSPYGLRTVETVYEVELKDHATLGSACYMVIGGYRVKVPCS